LEKGFLYCVPVHRKRIPLPRMIARKARRL
jgi:hypothetical protein